MEPAKSLDKNILDSKESSVGIIIKSSHRSFIVILAAYLHLPHGILLCFCFCGSAVASALDQIVEIIRMPETREIMNGLYYPRNDVLWGNKVGGGVIFEGVETSRDSENALVV